MNRVKVMENKIVWKFPGILSPVLDIIDFVSDWKTKVMGLTVTSWIFA